MNKSKFANYYHANNIKVLISLKDYLESSPARMKLWYRFTAVLTQINEGVSDIMEIMRLREVMEDLITDYWTTAKKQIRLTNQWNKLTPKQQEAKRKQWAKELAQEENELLTQLRKSEQKRLGKNNSLTAEPETESKEVKSTCANCYEYQKVNAETGYCRKCTKEDE